MFKNEHRSKLTAATVLERDEGMKRSVDSSNVFTPHFLIAFCCRTSVAGTVTSRRKWIEAQSMPGRTKNSQITATRSCTVHCTVRSPFGCHFIALCFQFIICRKILLLIIIKTGFIRIIERSPACTICTVVLCPKC